MSVLTRPRALLLDLDGTILDHERANRSAILSVMATAGITGSNPDESVSLWRDLEAEHFQRYLDGELDFEEQRVVRVRAFLESLGRTERDRTALLRWFEDYRTAYEEAWHPFADVRPFLEGVASLDAAPALAVVTNGDQRQQASKLEALGLGRLPLHASGQIGARKPDRAIFVHACEALGVSPADTWFVGDNYEADAVGAVHAGLFGVWLDRRGDTDPCSQPARAATLLDVLEWIEKLQ
ncbi:MAG: HAD family hydrolase [Pseudoclavibacter sp.]|nr:HAD family hydrolase [Pseudoclavibacter sp.]